MARSSSAAKSGRTDADLKTYTAMNVREGSNDNRLSGTARRDTVEKILENEWVDGAVCEGRYTDDYKRDAARDFGKGSVSPAAVLESMEQVAPKRCWVKLKDNGRQVLVVYWSFQSYALELDTRQVRFDFGDSA